MYTPLFAKIIIKAKRDYKTVHKHIFLYNSKTELVYYMSLMIIHYFNQGLSFTIFFNVVYFLLSGRIGMLYTVVIVCCDGLSPLNECVTKIIKHHIL